jgi:tetratricopeptide (TPR) repeat protein
MRAQARWAIVAALLAGCAGSAQSYNQRGVGLFNDGQHEAALAEFMAATSQDPQNGDAFYNLGSTYHRVGYQSEAEWNYARCLAIEPSHSKCRHALVVLMLQQQRTDDAYACVERWMRQSPGHPDPLIEMAWLEKQVGQTENARELLQQAVGIQPRHPRALAELASLYESSQPDRALGLYERALAHDPSESELARKVADLRDTSLSGSLDRERAQNQLANTPAWRPLARDLRYEVR